MKVYNLACPLDHRFEGWFVSEDDCLSQQTSGALICPICDSGEITRLPSAPHIAKTNNSNELAQVKSGAMAVSGHDHSQVEKQMQATLMKAMRDLMVRSEDVGPAFAEEARKIHYQEAPERSIRGQTTSDEAQSLREEGINVFALPEIPALKTTLQ